MSSEPDESDTVEQPRSSDTTEALGDELPTQDDDGDETGATVTVGVRRKRARTAIPARIGRYEVQAMIGRGGMGNVYRARDPELDRLVALKLLHVRGRSERHMKQGRQRLLREAQALAQLSHPNVIAVHDVGDIGDSVFIAMELVDGVTMRKAIRDEPLERAAIIDMFVAAGRGLAAAHEAGIVHRDFKPSNVMIGSDGRVRVLDFGLARAAAIDELSESTDPSAPDSDVSDSDQQRSLLSSPLTQHGAMVGTPAYMAPEQVLGTAVDARTDQYSFCVALFEALARERPDLDLSPDALEAVLANARVPRRLRRLVMRGLSHEPADRFGSMNALLYELSRDARARSRRIAVGVAITSLAAVAVWAVASRGDGAADERCTGAAGHTDAVWNKANAGQLRDAFLATNQPHAPDTADRVIASLDGYRDEWVERHTATCKAHHELGELSAAQLDLRMSCLTRKLHALEATARVLSSDVDAALLNEAVRAALSLPELSECVDDDVLRASYPPPTDDALRARIDELEQELARAEALLHVGEATSGLELGLELEPRAIEIGYPPLVARVQLLVGNLEVLLGKHEAGDATLLRAALSAAEARDDVRTADAWTLRMRSYLTQARFDDAETQSEAARVAVARLGDSPDEQAALAYSMAWLLIMRDDIPRARQHAERALRLWTDELGPGDPTVARAHIMLGNVATVEENVDAAVSAYESAIAILTASLGEAHPDIADALHNLANVLLDQGRGDEALVHAQRAARIVEGVYPPEHPRRATATWLEGRVQLGRGHADEAHALVGKAVQMFRRDETADPTQLAHSIRILAEITASQGRHGAAARLYEEALERHSAIFGDSDSQLIEILEHLATAKDHLGATSDAEALRARAATIAAAQPAP